MFTTLNRRIRNAIAAAVLPVTLSFGIAGTTFGQLVPPGTPGFGPVAPAPATVHEIDGQVFHYVVPAGWNANETSTGVVVTSPDGTAFFGITAVQVQLGQNSSAEQILRGVLQNAGLQNVQILQTAPVSDVQGIVALITFTMPNGMACKGMVCLGFAQSQNGPMGMLSFAVCSPDKFDTEGRALASLVQQIHVKNVAPVATPPSDGAPTQPGFPN